MESDATHNAGDGFVLFDARSRGDRRLSRTALVRLARRFNRRDRLALAYCHRRAFTPGRFRTRIVMQGLVWIRKMKGPFYLALPIWLQRALAAVVSPIAYLCGYRAVYKRFSGEEW